MEDFLVINNPVLHLYPKLVDDEPKILTPDYIWIAGITQEPFTRNYYLVYYFNIGPILERFVRVVPTRNHNKLHLLKFEDFSEIQEIGSGGYGTVYTAKCSAFDKPVVLKRYKSSDQTPELFISEVNVNTNS